MKYVSGQVHFMQFPFGTCCCSLCINYSYVQFRDWLKYIFCCKSYKWTVDELLARKIEVSNSNFF